MRFETQLGRQASPPLLELRKVTKAFGAVRALKGISFDLRAGEVHALLGENGAGKSTLIKIVTGAHAPDDGVLEIEGVAIANLTPAEARRRGIACVYQQPALFPDLSVAENLALRLDPGKFFSRVDWPMRFRRATELLGRVGARIDPNTEVRELSMPDQQLVEIAGAVGAGARIVVMDEPTASLTQAEQRLLFATVREMRQNGVGIIYISHRLEEIFALADRVTVLRDGESVHTCAVGEVSEAELIQHMVGRLVIETSEAAAKGAPGKTRLTLNQLGCQAGRVSEVLLEVRTGEIVGLAGLVGSGRTELARTVFGITPADRGEIWIEGRRVTIRSPQEAVQQGIGYVPEDRRRQGIILEMPLAANVTMAIHRRIFPLGWLRLRAERILAVEYLRKLRVTPASPEASAHTLSGGNQQKVALARWLATRPKVLILDEPTQGVDVAAKSEIHRHIRQLAQAGMAVLLISSDLPEILSLSDRIAIMRAGTIVATLPGGSRAAEVMGWALGREGVSEAPWNP